jgi:hypothetical protein
LGGPTLKILLIDPLIQMRESEFSLPKNAFFRGAPALKIQCGARVRRSEGVDPPIDIGKIPE